VFSSPLNYKKILKHTTEHLAQQSCNQYLKEFTTDKKTGYTRIHTDFNAGTYSIIDHKGTKDTKGETVQGRVLRTILYLPGVSAPNSDIPFVPQSTKQCR